MADRAHIRLMGSVWAFQQAFDGTTDSRGKSRSFRTEDDRKVLLTQAPIGYQVGNDKLVAATDTLNDVSAGSDVIIDVGNPEWVVEIDGSSCSRTRTLRDKTAQEIDDEKDALLQHFDVASRDEFYALAIVVKGALALMLEMINVERGNHGQGAINLSTFVSQFELHEDDITVSQFRAYLKDRMG